MHHIVIFHGTMRQGQYTQHVTKFVNEVVSRHPEVKTTVVDPRELDLSWDNEGQSASPDSLTQLVTDADAYIICSPEYNHGYPGSLKYVLDLNLKQYIHKPVAFVGVSAGPFGGTRLIESLTTVVRELGMVATFRDVNVSNVHKEIQDSSFQDPAKWEKRINSMLDELLWMSETLRYGRENVTVYKNA